MGKNRVNLLIEPFLDEEINKFTHSSRQKEALRKHLKHQIQKQDQEYASLGKSLSHRYESVLPYSEEKTA